MVQSWIREDLYPGWSQTFRVDRELVRLRSQFQEIAIVETSSHGRVMILDGIVQITERDEFVYQEMLAHVPLMTHGECRRVLIIGAGDGGVLRRVLQHRSVQEVVLVEIDEEVVRLAREFLPEIGGAAWHDSRVRLVIGDGINFVGALPAGGFDVMIVDSTDPIGVGETLFTESFYGDAKRVLSSRGLIVNQCGVPFMQSEELRQTSLLRAKSFAHVGAYVVAVPTYVGGFMAIGIASKMAAFEPGTVSTISERAAASGILGTTNYWCPETHVAAFALPPYIARLLPSSSGSGCLSDIGEALD